MSKFINAKINQNQTTKLSTRAFAGRHRGTEAEILREWALSPGQCHADPSALQTTARRSIFSRWKRRDAFHSLEGRRKLLQSAVDALKIVVPNVPYNLASSLPHGGWTENYREQQEAIESTARLAGWIRAIATQPNEHRHLVRMFNKVMSRNGVGSPANRLSPADLCRLAGSYSPGRANRLAAKVIARADMILEPYGLRVSYLGVCKALLTGGGRVGKLARFAAEETARKMLEGMGVPLHIETLGRVSIFRGFTRWRPALGRQAIMGEATYALYLLQGYSTWTQLGTLERQWAVDRLRAGEFHSLREAAEQASRLVADKTDGVEGLTDPTLSRSIRGASLRPIWHAIRMTTRRGISDVIRQVWLVRAGDRTYHANTTDPRQAVVDARAAWDRQVEAARAERELLPVILGQHPRVAALVYRRHSYDAGNCSSGTEAWITRMGIDSTRPFVPVHQLWPLAVNSGDSRAINTCRRAAREALNALSTGN